jgi:hypothetical protein
MAFLGPSKERITGGHGCGGSNFGRLGVGAEFEYGSFRTLSLSTETTAS